MHVRTARELCDHPDRSAVDEGHAAEVEQDSRRAPSGRLSDRIGDHVDGGEVDVAPDADGEKVSAGIDSDPHPRGAFEPVEKPGRALGTVRYLATPGALTRSQ